jgi:hypothetical protein
VTSVPRSKTWHTRSSAALTAPFRYVSRLTISPVFITAGLLALTVFIFEKYILGRWTFPWDFVGAYTTTPAFVAATIGTGHVLSWSPFVASGFPVDIDPQAGMYYPGWWLLGILGIPATLRVLTVVQIAHVLFGSIGVLALGRVRRLGWSWAAVAAVAYLFFGGFYAEAEHADIVRGFAYAPWLLWALTPPAGIGRWARLAAAPLLAWLIVSGAYPGQVISFGITGLVYLVVALRSSGREMWRQYSGSLVLAGTASAAVCVAVLLPYVRAEHAHELFRVNPTVEGLAGASLTPLNALGLYLNNFAWDRDGTIVSIAVGIPTLIGIACIRRNTLRRHGPLVACGSVALVLAAMPQFGFVDRAMISLHTPSRFPMSDYKAIIAVALVVLAAESWAQIATNRRGLIWRAMLAAGVLVVGALLAPSTYGQPTRALWLLITVAAACVVLVALRLPTRLLICLLVGLVVIDGIREINDYRFLEVISPWQVPPSEAAPYRARDIYVRKLSALLDQAPVSRPARVPPYTPLDSEPTGSTPDASGWVADGYHLNDYGGTIERVLAQAEHNPALTSLLLAPWHAYVFPCAAVGCRSGAVHLPSPTTWTPSPAVHTLAYSPKGIVYIVRVSQPVLMVENELAINGWRANTRRVSLVNAKIPLRTWRLSPGSYQFTATFHEPDRTLQELVAVTALIAWFGCALVVLRKPTTRPGSCSRASAPSSPTH